MLEVKPPCTGKDVVTHVLKCDSNAFWFVHTGEKRAEFRKNDRGYKLYDRLLLCEYKNGRVTGNKLLCEITHIQTGYGIPDGYAMISLHLL